MKKSGKYLFTDKRKRTQCPTKVCCHPTTCGGGKQLYEDEAVACVCGSLFCSLDCVAQHQAIGKCRCGRSAASQSAFKAVPRPAMTYSSSGPTYSPQTVVPNAAHGSMSAADICLQGMHMACVTAAEVQRQLNTTVTTLAATAAHAQLQQQQQQQRWAAGTAQGQQHPALQSLTGLPGLPVHHSTALQPPQRLARAAPPAPAFAIPGMSRPLATLLLQQQQQQHGILSTFAAAAAPGTAVGGSARAKAAGGTSAAAAIQAAAADAAPAAAAAAMGPAAGMYDVPAEPVEQLPPAPEDAGLGLFLQHPNQLQLLMQQQEQQQQVLMQQQQQQVLMQQQQQGLMQQQQQVLMQPQGQHQEQQQQGVPGAAAASSSAVAALALPEGLSGVCETSLVKLKHKFLDLKPKVVTLRELRGRFTGPTVVVSDTNIEAVYIPSALLPDPSKMDDVLEMQRLLDNLVVIWRDGENVHRAEGTSKAPMVMVGWRQPTGGPSVLGPYHIPFHVYTAGDSAARSLSKVAETFVDMDACRAIFLNSSTMDSVVPIRGMPDTTQLPVPPPSVGGAPATALSLSLNYKSESHQDKGDGQWSIIAWRYHGGEVPDAGRFYMGTEPHSDENPGAYFEIGDGDVLFINTKVLFHHTQRPASLCDTAVHKSLQQPAVFGMALLYKPDTVAAMAEQEGNKRVQLFERKRERKQQQEGQQQEKKTKKQAQPRQQGVEQQLEQQLQRQAQQQQRAERLKRRQGQQEPREQQQQRKSKRQQR